MWIKLIFALISLVLLKKTSCLPDGGISQVELNERTKRVGVPKSLYKNTKITIRIDCKADEKSEINFRWIIRETSCIDRNAQQSLASIIEEKFSSARNIHKLRYIKSEAKLSECDIYPSHVLMRNDSRQVWQECVRDDVKEDFICKAKKTISSRSVQSQLLDSWKTSRYPGQTDHSQVTAPTDGIYMIVVIAERRDPDKLTAFQATVEISTESEYGYLSAVDWPLLPFYGFMSLVYLCFAVLWMVLCFINLKNLVRVHLWIGCVIFLGMLEKAFFYSEFQTINSSGQAVIYAVVLGEIVSSLKKALSRMLIIVVSLGFGIIKPRLGDSFFKVLSAGAIYFCLSLMEAILRLVNQRERPSRKASFGILPITLADTVIWYWIFISLVSTIRQLRIRRNLAKLRLFTRFFTTLTISVVLSVGFLFWSMVSHNVGICIYSWRSLWLDDAFWHLLFSLVLGVIMILWRPSSESRFAFSPLHEDDAFDEDIANPFIRKSNEYNAEESYEMMNRGAKSLKIIDKQQTLNVLSKSKKSHDFVWLDESLPNKIIDALVDSEEELMSQEVESSKIL